MPMVSSHKLVVWPSGASRVPTHSEANAPPSAKGNAPVLTCAPRYRNRVATTRKIMNTVHDLPGRRDPVPVSRGAVNTGAFPFADGGAFASEWVGTLLAPLG